MDYYRYLNSSAWTGRAKRTAGEAFKDAEYAQAFWPHEKAKSRWDVWLTWAAILICVLSFLVYNYHALVE